MSLAWVRDGFVRLFRYPALRLVLLTALPETIEQIFQAAAQEAAAVQW